MATYHLIKAARRFGLLPEPARSKAFADLARWYDVDLATVRRLAGCGSEGDELRARVRIDNMVWWALHGVPPVHPANARLDRPEGAAGGTHG